MPDQQEMLNQSLSDLGTSISNFFSNNLLTILLSILGALVILLIGRWLARYVSRLTSRWFAVRSVEPTVAKFLAKTVYIAVLAMALVVALSLLGVPMNSFIALLGASALAIGLALQSSLSNLASGLLLILLKPYSVGHVVEIGDKRLAGSVEAIDFFHTALRAPDNSLLLIPNSEVMGNPIINFTEIQWRRVDMEFGIGYDDDLLLAKQILHDVAKADPRVLDDPPVRVAVRELGENSVNLVLQPYVRPPDYLSSRFDLTEQVKLRFDEAGISFPFPQRTISVVMTNGAAVPADGSES
jgi:small conductance mechanosensitive channel